MEVVKNFTVKSSTSCNGPRLALCHSVPQPNSLPGSCCGCYGCPNTFSHLRVCIDAIQVGGVRKGVSVWSLRVCIQV